MAWKTGKDEASLSLVMRASCFLVLASICGVVVSSGCPANGISDDGTTAVDTGETGIGQVGMLGCPAAEECTFVFVSQTLDDRVEIFAPDDRDANVYRGTIDLDLKPNIDGDNSGGLLDEPFGLALAGGHLHVLVGHYPQRDRGSLLSFPLDFFESFDVGRTIAVDSFYSQGAFADEVAHLPLGEEEPIFMLPYGNRLLVSVFNNDLFTAESQWVAPGKLIVLDSADPSEFGILDLDHLEGGSCDGAAQIVDIGGGRVALACDGNDAIAFLDVSAIQGGDPAVAAATITGNLCPLPVASERRVRYLAPEGPSGVVVAVGPGGLSALGAADLHLVDAHTCFRGITPVASNGQAQLGQIVRHASDRWLLASGAGQLTSGGMRGVYVVRNTGGGLEVCDAPVGGFGEHWDTPGQPTDPFALALTEDGRHLAVGASPVNPEAADGIHGKVLWATLPAFDENPCMATAAVTDLTDGPLATDPDRVDTWRRAPDVISIARVRG